LLMFEPTHPMLHVCFIQLKVKSPAAVAAKSASTPVYTPYDAAYLTAGTHVCLKSEKRGWNCGEASCDAGLPSNKRMMGGKSSTDGREKWVAKAKASRLRRP
jgi:uncharacterized low-complexity protein